MENHVWESVFEDVRSSLASIVEVVGAWAIRYVVMGKAASHVSLSMKSWGGGGSTVGMCRGVLLGERYVMWALWWSCLCWGYFCLF